MSTIISERDLSELPSSTEIIDGRLYLGNLASSIDLEYRTKLGITHTVCVCQEGLQARTVATDSQHHDVKSSGTESKNDRFLYIPVEDDEYEDILTHLPLACAFIEKSLLPTGSRVLVHCKMGVSRSVTIIAAYLMKSRQMKSFDAVEYIKERRPQIHPNYGFLKQLEKFEQSSYTAPSPRDSAYRSWKRKYAQDVQSYLGYAGDIVSIGMKDGEGSSSGDALYLASDLPEDLQQSRHLLREFEVTDVVLVGSDSEECEVKAAAGELGLQVHEVADLSSAQSGWGVVGGEVDDEWLEKSVLGACRWMLQAVRKRTGQHGHRNILVYSPNEARACVVICAYLMTSKKASSREALSTLKRHLPLFNPSQPFLRQLEALERLNGSPSYPNTAPLAASPPSSLARTPVAVSLF